MSHVHVSDDLYLAVCNFESEGKGSKKGEHVALLKFCDENGDAPKYGKGFNPGKLKALLTSPHRDKLIALCDESIALADNANAKTVKPAASRPAAPASSVVYFTFDGTNQSAAIIDANTVRQFVAANAANEMAQIHCNGAWHPKANWSAIGFALPPAPPAPPAAPVAPPAPVASNAPAAPAAPAATREPTPLEKIAQRKLAAATA